MKLSAEMSPDDWAFVCSVAGGGGYQKLIAAIGWQESHWGSGTPGGPSSRDWILNYGYTDGPILSQWKGFANQIKGAVAMLKGFKPPITYASILNFCNDYWRCDDRVAWSQGIWSIYNSIVDDLSQNMVIINASGVIIYGRIENGSTWGPLAEVLKAKGITYSWNAATNTLSF
jgi:hypothetical protein